MRIRTLRIDAGNAGRSVHDLLKNEFGISESLISRLKRREGGILIDGRKAYTTFRVTPGETLTAEVGDAAEFDRPEGIAYPLSILYEDEDYIILDKPAGITVHASTRCPGEVTLENALAAYLPAGENPHPVSRLDRGTTGVIAFAKSGYAHELLRRQSHTADYQREYRAISLGVPKDRAGEIHSPIGFALNSTYQRAVDPAGAPALTRYEVLFERGGAAFLRLVPETGRTHQLRVHMASVDCPLAGDWLYGKENPSLLTRPALHSYSLSWRHPLTGRRIELIAPLPKDFKSVLRKFKLVPQSSRDC